MSIRILASTEPRNEAEYKRLQRIVVDSLKRTGSSGRSASGMTLAMAVEWCEANKRSYMIHAYPGAGYTLVLGAALTQENNDAG